MAKPELSRNPSRVVQRVPRSQVVNLRTTRGRDMAYGREEYEDFTAASGTTLPAWLGTQDTSAAGTPTLDYVDDVANGEFQLLTDATDEAQNITLYQGDQLTIDPTAEVIFECRWKIDMDTDPMSADERIVVGLAAARNATLDSNTHHAWFKVDGDANIVWETDDATTNDDDNDTGYDLADNTYVTCRIELREGNALFYILSAQAEWDLVGQGDMSNAAATDLLQVYIEFQKDGGTETEDVRIDYVYLHAGRAD